MAKTAQRYRLMLDFATKKDMLDFVADMKAHGAAPVTADVWHADSLDHNKSTLDCVLSNDPRVRKVERGDA